MKTIGLAITACILGLLLLSSCGRSDEVRIGFSVGPSHERWEKDIDYFSARIRNAGATLYVAEAENSHQKQMEQVRDLLKRGIDVLVIVPVDSRKASEIVCLAHENGIRVIAYDRIVNDCDLDFYISFDNMRVGEMQAEYLSRMRPEGYYALLGGDAGDNNSILLRLGQMNVLAPLVESRKISVVVDQYIPGWNADEAYRIVDNYLSENPGRLDAVVASNDHIAGGAFRALEKHGLAGKVLLSGQDAEAEACRRIIEGKQTMTVYKYIETLATSAASTALALARGEPVMNTQLSINNGQVMVPSILLSSMVSVHPENLRMTVIADGYIDESMVFENR
ncbi:MAG: sugar ABC transporter substrate-binding protein [Marinilabiliales bacterium]|nr:MAG: sugar ABC transporter substrate-binding protein [Marinilabiliales bacterium]